MILTPSISYTNSKIQNFVGYDYLARQRDFSGEPFPMAPKWQWRISAEQSVTVNNAWTFFAGMDISYQDSTYTSFGREADLYVKDYTLLGLRAGIESEKWRATVWARNIFDSWYWNSSVRLQDSLVRYTGMPRTLGVSLSYRFQ